MELKRMVRYRITPACAGISWRRAGPGRPPGDHPRVRGDKGEKKKGENAMQGSPPRARG